MESELPVVIDNGSHTLKMGLALDASPAVFDRNVMGGDKFGQEAID